MNAAHIAWDNGRTARIPEAGEPFFVIATGAPRHYVSGYGLVGPAAIVSLPIGEEVSPWMGTITPEQAREAQADIAVARQLADAAAAAMEG